MARQVKIFGGTASKYLAEQIASHYGADLGDVQVVRFSDGEFSPSFDESVRGCDVFIIQSTFSPTDNLLSCYYSLMLLKEHRHIT